MTLEELLAQLAILTERAQQRWEAEQRADEENDYADDEEVEGDLWLTLECNLSGFWLCGWRVQQDEATVWAMHQAGRTPIEAARRMLGAFERVE